MIKAIFQSTGVEESDYGKKGVYIFTDLSLNNEPLADKYVFPSLKCFSKLKPKKGDVFEFDATISRDGGLEIKRPKQVKKLDLSNLKDGFEKSINKFLKESRVLTKDDSRKEKVAYLRITNLFGEEILNFVSLPFRLNSLYWFLTEDGQKFLKQEKSKLDKQIDLTYEEESVILENKKIGEDVKVDSKKQTLMNFLK